MVDGVTKLIMMKSDVLDSFETIKACVAYKMDEEEIDYFPFDINETVEPVYVELPGWQTDTLLVALVCQFFQNIPLKRGGIHNIVIGKACVEHGKAIVMPGREADILCPGRFDG